MTCKHPLQHATIVKASCHACTRHPDKSHAIKGWQPAVCLGLLPWTVKQQSSSCRLAKKHCSFVMHAADLSTKRSWDNAHSSERVILCLILKKKKSTNSFSGNINWVLILFVPSINLVAMPNNNWHVLFYFCGNLMQVCWLQGHNNLWRSMTMSVLIWNEQMQPLHHCCMFSACRAIWTILHGSDANTKTLAVVNFPLQQKINWKDLST